MALTPLQKAQNKAAQQVKREAYKRRRSEFMKALGDAERDPTLLAARAAYELANNASSQHLDARAQRIAHMRAQIAELEDRIKAEMANPEIEALNQERRVKSNAWNNLAQALKDQVRDQFPDIGRTDAEFSEAAWRPPAEVLAAMETARQSATVETVDDSGLAAGEQPAARDRPRNH